MAARAICLHDWLNLERVERIRSCRLLSTWTQPARPLLQHGRRVFGKILVPVSERPTLMRSPQHQYHRDKKERRINPLVARAGQVRCPCRPGHSAKSHHDRKGYATPHMSNDARTCITTAIRQQKPENCRNDTREDAEPQYQTCSLPQRRPSPARQLQQWKQQNQANRKVYHQRMKSSQKLRQLAMRLSVQPKHNGHQAQHRATQQGCQRNYPWSMASRSDLWNFKGQTVASVYCASEDGGTLPGQVRLGLLPHLHCQITLAANDLSCKQLPLDRPSLALIFN